MNSLRDALASLDLEAKENICEALSKPLQSPLECQEISQWAPRSLAYSKALSPSQLPLSNALTLHQSHVTPTMRSILADWMMEVCAEFTLKRETFYLALNYIDRVMQTLPNIKKEEFQLIGLACMVIAAKTEEIYTPKLEDWAKSADDGYSLREIKQTERRILKSLGWKLLPPTACTWLHWLMTQWDDFIEYNFGCVQYNNPKDFDNLPRAVRRQFKEEFYQRYIVFTASNKPSYQRFRDAFQLLDIAQLEHTVLEFTPRLISLSVLFLVVNQCFIETNFELLSFGEEPDEELDEVENRQIVQRLFKEFAQASAQLEELTELYQCLQFLEPFMEVRTDYSLPVACKYKHKSKLETHYHDFLAYQTHNPQNLEFISEQA